MASGENVLWVVTATNAATGKLHSQTIFRTREAAATWAFDRQVKSQRQTYKVVHATWGPEQ